MAVTKTKARRARSLRALALSTGGNTMALMGAAMIPLAAMTGSAIDMSRLYMVKVRLQQACDAGALAGRRFMTGATLDTAAEAEARKFFASNFPTGWMGATSVSFTPDETAEGQVHAEARATVPMALMQMFGFNPIPIEAECDAKFEISNTDIMFVLDVTGSMNCAASDTPSTCGNNNGVEKSNARIKALRTAVVDFYDTINTAVDDSARLRIGFVPYSSGVRVGQLLRTKNASWLSDSWNYQARVANFTTAFHAPIPQTPVLEETVQQFSYLHIKQADCAKYGQNASFSLDDSNHEYSFGGGNNPSRISGGPPPTQTLDYTYSNDPSPGADWGWPGAPDNDGTYQTCRRKRVKHNTNYETRYKFTNWTYKRVLNVDTSTYKTGTAVALATPVPKPSPNEAQYYVPGSVLTSGSYSLQQLAALGRPDIPTANYTWDGCIEERQWVTQASFSSIPSGAYDLDIDTIPSSAETRWRPTFVTLIHRRANDAEEANKSSEYWQPTAGNTFYACPKAATKLAEMTKAQVESYVSIANGFVPIGGTYHDFGMIWGARLLSPTGILGDENATAPNGKPISRHLIFMTDGDMSPNTQIYGLYGMEMVDQRVGGVDSPGVDMLKTRHNARFTAICNAARAKNITIWVVAYAQSMTTELKDCANPGKAFYASSDAELKSQFKQIAQQIAKLRLAQ